MPQGTVLGTILFIIYINGLLNLNNNSKMISYADDSVIVLSDNSTDSLLYSNANSNIMFGKIGLTTIYLNYILRNLNIYIFNSTYEPALNNKIIVPSIKCNVNCNNSTTFEQVNSIKILYYNNG